MKKVVCAVFAFMALTCIQPVMASVTMEQLMKQMGHSFKRAHQATTVEQMSEALEAFNGALAQAKVTGFSGKKAALMQQGLQELENATAVTQQWLKEDDLVKAKQSLLKVDALRDYYHDERNPSIWELLFGL